MLKEKGRRKEARQGLIRLRKLYGMEQLVRKMSWARSVLTDVEKERHNGTDGDWQQQTLCKKSLYLSDTAVTWRFEGVLMRRPYEAAKSGYCEIYLEVLLEDGRLSKWVSVKVRECRNEVEFENENRKNIAQDIFA